MYIRQIKKKRSKDSKTFYQYSLAQTFRAEGKVKQSVVLYLGSEPRMADKQTRQTVLQILKAKIFKQESLFPMDADPQTVSLAMSYFEKYCLKYGEDSLGGASIPPPPQKADYHNVDLEGLETEEVHTFGGEHLCKQVLEKLELQPFLSSLGFSQKEQSLALISITSRALFTSSEHKTAQILTTNSSMSDCFHYQDTIDHRKLYAISDKLYEHKDQIDSYLYNRITSMFELEDKLVIYDLSNTYFETGKHSSQIASYGRSKEKRSDCPLVVFTGVINAEGFIRHSRIYEGNTADTTTLADMLEDLEIHTDPKSKQTVVMDAGIASEDNLKLIREKGYHYVCVSRHQLKDHSFDTEQKQVIYDTDSGKSNVKLKVFTPTQEHFNDTWMHVQSEAKQRKEQSMDIKLTQRYEQELQTIEASLHKKGGTKKIEKVYERIGRAKERNRRISTKYEIEVANENGIVTSITWKKKEVSKSKTDKTDGIYFIRTSYSNTNEEELWKVYNTIREVEATFRCLKSDLAIRPVYHQKDERIEAHIYLTMLAYQLVNTIRYMLKEKDIHHDWKNIVRIMNTQTIQNIVLPTETKTIHFRKPSKPIKQVQDIYNATNCEHTQKAIKKYVVYH